MRIEDGNIYEVMRIILPEHRQMMDQLKKESTKKIKPVLSEDQLIEMQEMVSQALENKLSIKVTIFGPYADIVFIGIPFISDNSLHVYTFDGPRHITIESVIRIEFEK